MTPYYEKAGITIYHGDCREVTPLLSDGRMHMVMTDPPYGYNYLGYKNRYIDRALANDSPSDFEMVEWSFRECQRLLVPGGYAAYFCSGSKAEVFARWVLAMGTYLKFDALVMWRKPGLGLGSRYRGCYETILLAYEPTDKPRWFGGKGEGNVIEHKRVLPVKPDGHPTPKPVSLIAHFLQLHSVPGDLILDPFMGEGSTLLAARAGGRGAIGIEIDERWCERAAARLEASAT